MMRFLLVLTVIKTAFSIVTSKYQVLDTNRKYATDVFSDSVLNGTQFERIQHIVSNPSTKKYETVRKFLTHYNSLKPVAVLVDDTEETFDDAKNFMRQIFEVTPNAKYIPLSLQIFNTTGVSEAVEVKGNKTFDYLLNYKKERGLSHLDPTLSNGTATFFAILNAANILKQDSAILVFIDRKTNDEDLAPHTGLLRKKNIKVYAIWGGIYPMKNNLLMELCEYSGGLFLVNTGKDMSDYYFRRFLEDRNSYMNTSIILSKNNLHGTSDLTFPIDSKVTGIHIKIAPYISKGTVLTPKGYTIDILRKEEISGYSTGSFGVIDKGIHEVHLNLTTKPTLDVGIWRLMLSNAHEPYNATVFVYTKLTTRAYLITKNTRYGNSTGSHGEVMKLGISPYIKSISAISFVDRDGHPTADKTKYTLVKDSLIENNVSDQEREIDIELFDVPTGPVYALIQGKDTEDNDFSRLTYVSSYNSNEIFPQPTLTTEVGSASELITTGGRFPVIIFEVTNHKNTAVDVRFTCEDNKSILRFLNPRRQIIAPQETAIVKLTLVTRFGSYEDEITFKAWIGSESFIKKVIVDVGGQALYDNEEPEIEYSFPSDCSKVVLSKCSGGTWTVKITAKDTGTGLLQVTSYPRGLYFPNGFTTGTREEVVGYYSDSCCSPDLQITAIDRLNNRKIINVNAYQAFWGPAQIAAVVLGVLILILIIVLIIYLVRRCIKKRENYNLPTYRGGKI